MIRNIKMPKRVWLPALLVVVAVAVIGGGVALAANIISNVWQSPVITVNDPVTPPTPPPSNGQLVISSTDFTSNRTIGTDNASRFTISLSNPSETGAPGYTGVRVLFEVNKSGTIADGDVTLKYSDGTNWYDLPVTLVDGKLIGYFGPEAGFSVPSGYTATTPIEATFHTAGSYWANVQAVTVGS